MRTTPILVAIAVAGALSGCGGQHARDGDDAPGKRIKIEGTISVRGSTPFTHLAVETDGGDVYLIESADADLMRELQSLDGMRGAIEGTVLPPGGTQAARVDIARYELLALPGGETPMVGVVGAEGDACVFTARDGARYWLRGDLVPVLREYDGARLWIVGVRADDGGAGRPRKSTPFTPTGYGVIDEAPAR